MANSKGCGCYGALNSVPGPLQCGCQAADPRYYQNFPFYSGPCAPGPVPPCAQCPCRHCRLCCRDNDDAQVEPASVCADVPATLQPLSAFIASCPFRLEPDACVPLRPSVMNTALFEAAEDGVRIRKAGTYLATYTVNLPPQQRANTQFVLRLDGREVAGSRQNLISPAGVPSPTGVSAQAIVQAGENCLLSLNSCGELAAAGTDENWITLTLLRI